MNGRCPPLESSQAVDGGERGVIVMIFSAVTAEVKSSSARARSSTCGLELHLGDPGASLRHAARTCQNSQDGEDVRQRRDVVVQERTDGDSEVLLVGVGPSWPRLSDPSFSGPVAFSTRAAKYSACRCSTSARSRSRASCSPASSRTHANMWNLGPTLVVVTFTKPRPARASMRSAPDLRRAKTRAPPRRLPPIPRRRPTAWPASAASAR